MTLKLLNGLQRVGSTFTDFGMIPFTTEVTNWENFPVCDSYFMHGSTKALKTFLDPAIKASDIFINCDESVARELVERVQAGIFYDIKKFDMSEYKDVLGRDLLNSHGTVMTLGEVLELDFPQDMFIKPCRDLKLFDGQIFPGNVKVVDHLNTQTVDCTLYNDFEEKVIVSRPVQILAEWRFFVVKSKIVARSQYRLHGELKPDSRVPAYVVDAAAKMARMYQPAEAFVMDLAMTGDLQLKVVEYNCINCSGMYEADVGKLAWELRKIGESR